MFRQSIGDRLDLSAWQTVLRDARAMGVMTVRISGGEPTLFKELLQLVDLARENADQVLLYSNGRLLDPHLAQQLKVRGLDGVSISLLSLRPHLHDHLRQTPGSQKWAIDACRAAVAADIRLSIHVIVCRHNYRELPEMIRFAAVVGASALELHYPENDIGCRYLLMDPCDIRIWRDEVSRLCAATLEELRPEMVGSSAGVLEKLYSAHGDEADHSRGIYWPSKEAAGVCTKPVSFAMVYPNGDVLPCNGVEYAHEPVVGNVRRTSLRDIWESTAFQEFRAERTSWCKFCPMMHHSKVMLT
jgi:pyrroloquinoline quinone biosynthesis protein E